MIIKQLTKDNTRIKYFEANSNYTFVHFIDGRKLLIASTLKMLEGRITPEFFIRVHKKYLVNKSCITDVYHKNAHIYLSDGTSLPIARRRKNVFKP